jgi:hypothetical protein
VGLAEQLKDRLVAHRSNLLRLPEEPPPIAGSVHATLAEAASTGEVLFHGSNARTIEVFEPREQLTARGRPVEAVFATQDPLWAMFFAVTDTERAIGRWNMCLRPEETGLPTSRYFFAVLGEPERVWTTGAVYVLPRATFHQSDIAAEWISTVQVVPRETVRVTREDFPFADRVFQFKYPESEWRRIARLAANGFAPTRKWSQARRCNP